jgi:hypothetical protein
MLWNAQASTGGISYYDRWIVATQIGASGGSSGSITTTPYRYIGFQLYTSGNMGLAEIFGYTTVGGTTDIFTGGTAYSTVADDGVDHIANLFDGNISTDWGAAGGVTNAFVYYDLGSGHSSTLAQLKIYPRASYASQGPFKIEVYASNDGVAWKPTGNLFIPATWVSGTAQTFNLS